MGSFYRRDLHGKETDSSERVTSVQEEANDATREGLGSMTSEHNARGSVCFILTQTKYLIAGMNHFTNSTAIQYCSKFVQAECGRLGEREG